MREVIRYASAAVTLAGVIYFASESLRRNINIDSSQQRIFRGGADIRDVADYSVFIAGVLGVVGTGLTFLSYREKKNINNSR